MYKKGSRITKQILVETSNELHGIDRYKFDKIADGFVPATSKVSIFCSECNVYFDQMVMSHLKGYKHKPCTSKKAGDLYRFTQEQFLQKSKEAHPNNQYSYDKAIYKGNLEHVSIHCNIHDIDFDQTPAKHWYGHGCYLCGEERTLDALKYTQQEIIELAILSHSHNNNYSYENSVYIDIKTPMLINCSEHGDFYQIPGHHIRGTDCPDCGGSKKLTTEIFITRSNIKHNNKYTYNNSIYTNKYSIIMITCPDHGDFPQVAYNHMRGYGCPECAGNKKTLTTEIFITRSNIKHNNKYTYLNAVYINNYTPIMITCPDHKDFPQIPDKHMRGSGCPKCSNYSSKLEKEWLDYLHIPEQWRQQTVIFPNKEEGWCKPDALDLANKIAYEFNGDYWHGNLKFYNANDINEMNNTTFGELYMKKQYKEELLKRNGYTVISIWESQWLEMTDDINDQNTVKAA